MARRDDEDTSDLDDGEPGRSGPAAWFQRLLAGAPAPPPDDTPRGRRRAIERLNDRERRFSYLASLAALVFAVTIYLTETQNKHFHLAKGQLQPETTLLLGLAAGVVLGVSTYFGRRAPVAFVCLFAFFIFSNGGGVIIGIPFIGLGGWLFYRSFKNQRAALADQRGSSGSSSASKAATRPNRAASPSRSTAPARSNKKSSAPTANKRFTPKRPPPPAPKPSRRDRKAAEARDEP